MTAPQRLVRVTHRSAHAAEAPPAGAPGLLLLHGRGSDERDLLGLAPYFDDRFVVVSARAPQRLMNGWMWFEIAEIGVPHPAQLAESLGLIADLMQDMVAAEGVDPSKIYVLGFSQGAAMVGALLLTRPAALAGGVIVSGYVPLNAGLTVVEGGLTAKPVFQSHGQQDQVIPLRLAQTGRDYLRTVGAALTYHEYAAGHQIVRQNTEDVAAWLAHQLAEVGGEAKRTEA